MGRVKEGGRERKREKEGGRGEKRGGRNAGAWRGCAPGKCAGSVSGAYRGCDKMSGEPQEACSKAAHTRLWMHAFPSKINKFLHSGVETTIPARQHDSRAALRKNAPNQQNSRTRFVSCDD